MSLLVRLADCMDAIEGGNLFGVTRAGRCTVSASTSNDGTEAIPVCFGWSRVIDPPATTDDEGDADCPDAMAMPVGRRG